MCRQNRADPLGRILALGAGERSWATAAVSCMTRAHHSAGPSRSVLNHLPDEVSGRTRQVGAMAQYTELFFLDEAAALSAGHRPCFECRRAEADRFFTLWRRAVGAADAPLRRLDTELARGAPRAPVAGQHRQPCLPGGESIPAGRSS